jgi:hypothetical protein
MRSLAVTSLLLAACARPAATPVPQTTADDLWRLAPAGCRTGIVMTGPALASGLTTVRAVVASMRRSALPTAATLAAALHRNGIDFLAPDGPDGLDLTRGMAVFEVDGDVIVVYPARDPAAFVQGPSRNCRVHAGYAACGASDRLATLGTGDAGAAAAARPARLRGAVELVIDNAGTPVTGAIVVERGVLEIRVGIAAPMPLPTPAASPLLARLRSAPASGAIAVDARGVLPLFADRLAGTDFAPLAALRGDLVGVSLAGPDVRLWLALGLADVAAAQRVIDRCDELSNLLFALRASGGRCTATPTTTMIPLPPLEVHIEGDVAIVETAGAHAERGTPAPEIATLVEVPGLVAAWGRGISWRSAMPAPPRHDQAPSIPWLYERLDELAFVVRPVAGELEITLRVGTVFRNPDDVIARVDAILAPDQRPAAVAAALTALAGASPDSPLARSVAMGPGGLAMPVAAGGLAASLSIGPFLEYMDRARAAAPPP